MSSIGHATQLFLLALISLIGYIVLAVCHVHTPELEQLLREVILAALVGGSVAVPPRAAADVTVSGPVSVDTGPTTTTAAVTAAPGGSFDIHPDAPEESDL